MMRLAARVIAMTGNTIGDQKLAAFLIVEITEVHDEQTYAQYRERVPLTLAANGGAYLVRGGRVEVLEGSWKPKRVVIVRFDSAEAARSWWDDPGYSELKAMRQRSSTTNMILVEGISNA
jgi:uncharacterized protein (DUF1330 family)